MAYAVQMDTIPINLESRIPVTTAQIEDQILEVSFDSGSRVPIILKKAVLDRVRGVHYTGKLQEMHNAAGKKYKNHQFKLRHIKLDDYATNNIIGNIYSPWGVVFRANGPTSSRIEAQTETKLDGVFGLDIFKNRRIIFDYPSKKIAILYRDYFPEPYQSMNWTACQRTMSPIGILIEGVYMGKKGKFLLDTGATASFLKPSFLPTKTNKVGVQGDFQINEKASPVKVTFLLYEFNVSSIDGVLGYNFLANRRIYIDSNSQHQDLNACLISG